MSIFFNDQVNLQNKRRLFKMSSFSFKNYPFNGAHSDLFEVYNNKNIIP